MYILLEKRMFTNKPIKEPSKQQVKKKALEALVFCKNNGPKIIDLICNCLRVDAEEDAEEVAPRSRRTFSKSSPGGTAASSAAEGRGRRSSARPAAPGILVEL